MCVANSELHTGEKRRVHEQVDLCRSLNALVVLEHTRICRLLRERKDARVRGEPEVGARLAHPPHALGQRHCPRVLCGQPHDSHVCVCEC